MTVSVASLVDSVLSLVVNSIAATMMADEVVAGVAAVVVVAMTCVLAVGQLQWLVW